MRKAMNLAFIKISCGLYNLLMLDLCNACITDAGGNRLKAVKVDIFDTPLRPINVP